ncbi:MAG: hypothetical protein ACK4Z4_11095 [Ferrovibrio sp.]|jgi:hypothetical protein|nr:hypothetical protein [Alphaproteobacteria bacterium]
MAMNEEEQSKVTRESFVATWEALINGGVSREIVAAIAMSMALAELTSLFGKAVTAHGLEKLPDTIRSGAFDPKK